MDKEQFIEKSIEGGWQLDREFNDFVVDSVFGTYTFWFDGVLIKKLTIEQILLDPLAWEAVGKTENWGGTGVFKSCNGKDRELMNYEMIMHRMIDAVCEGHTIEEFLKKI